MKIKFENGNYLKDRWFWWDGMGGGGVVDVAEGGQAEVRDAGRRFVSTVRRFLLLCLHHQP